MFYNKTCHSAVNFKHEQVQPICFLSNGSKIQGQVKVTYWYIIFFLSFGGPVFLMTLAVMTQRHKKLLFLTLFILLGKNSFRDLVVASSTINASYLDSPKAQFCCPWKRGALISVTFLKISLSVPSKQGASSFFCQVSGASPIRFLKFTSKYSHCSKLSHIFAMTSSSGVKFGLKSSKCLKKLPLGDVPEV